MTVRVLMLEAPEDLLEERRRRGLDRHDEMWDGVLHVVPPAGGRHQDLGTQLVLLLSPVAERRGLRMLYESGFFSPGRDDDYRVPDLLVFEPEALRPRGLDGDAEVLFEIRSPGDESYEKLPFYLGHGVREVVIIDRDTLVVEVFRSLDADGQPVRAGDTAIRTLDVVLTREDDDHLAVALPDGRTERIRPLP